MFAVCESAHAQELDPTVVVNRAYEGRLLEVHKPSMTMTVPGFLMFLCILPMMLVSIVVRKGFLLSICISIVYSLGSFLASWVPPLAALLPIDVAWRIMDLQQFEMSYSFSMTVSIISISVITFISIIGIAYVSKKQEA